MLLTQKRQHAHLTSGEKAVKVSEVTANGDRNAVSSVTSRDERGSLPLFLSRHHPRTERGNWFLCAGTVSKLTDAGWNVAAASHLQRKLNVSSAWRIAPR